MIQPRGDFVLVRRLPEPKVTVGGLQLPEHVKRYFFRAEVIAAGPGVERNGSGDNIPLDLEPGDTVLCKADPPSDPRMGGVQHKNWVELSANGENYLLGSERIILAILTEPSVRVEALA